IADPEPAYAGADSLHLPSNVAAGDSILRPDQSEHEAREQGLAAYRMPVRRIDGNSQNLHQDLIGTRHRLLDLRQLKRPRRAVPLPQICLHARPDPARSWSSPTSSVSPRTAISATSPSRRSRELSENR